MEFYVATPEDTDRVLKEFWDLFKTSRYFINSNTTLLGQHIETIMREPYIVEPDKVLFRARILDEGVEQYLDSDLTAPPEKYVGVGRLNPRRIRYLYAAESDETAAAEMRPWINSTIVIATVTPKKQLNVVDFVPTEEEKTRPNSFKRQISEKLSAPVRPNIAEIEYLPTQAIAEHIKLKGFDGIRYQSAVDPDGVNYCFFNPDCFHITISRELRLNKIKYMF